MKAITTHYYGPTDTKGARIKVTDGDWNFLWVPYDHASPHPHDVAARAFCRKMAWSGTLVRGSANWSGAGHVYVWLTDDATLTVDPS